MHEPAPRDTHRLGRFLWWCAGAVPNLIRDSPTEHARYAGIGGAVLSTWCLASFAGGYALYTMAAGSPWRTPIAVAGGLVWGLVIFNIDRFLVSSLRKSGDGSMRSVVRTELVPALPRMALAVAIAVTIAEPIEMRLFASEIEDQIEANRDRLVAARQDMLRGIAEPEAAIWRGEIARIDAELAASRQRVETLQREYIEESDGRGGSGRVGAGPLTELKRVELERAVAEDRERRAQLAPRRAELQQRLDGAELELRDELASYRASLGSGYLARREALATLYEQRAGVAGAVWGIFALMVMIELAPLLLKILGGYGAYDAKLALAEDAAIREAQLERRYRIALAKYHYELAERAERAVEEASHDANVAVRTAKVRQAWAGFGEAFRPQEVPSIDALLRHFREALSMHRQP